MVARSLPKPAKPHNGPSIAIVRPKARGAHLSPPVAPGTGPALPSRTGKPWPGGGTVPPPDTGSHNAIRVDKARQPTQRGVTAKSVTPASPTPHIHV